MKKAVIYARFSSYGQTLRVCKEYANEENIAIGGEYIDRALIEISPTCLKRIKYI